MSKARTKINEAIKIFQAEPDSVAKSVLGIGVLAVAIAEIVVACSRDGSDSERQQIRAEALDAFRAYVSPLDIPGVPNVGVEPMLDAFIESALANLLDAGLGKLGELHAKVDAIIKAA